MNEFAFEPDLGAQLAYGELPEPHESERLNAIGERLLLAEGDPRHWLAGGAGLALVRALQALADCRASQ